MRVIDFQELCTLPGEPIFSKYDPCVVAGLYRRGGPLTIAGNDPDGALKKYYKGIYSDFLYYDLLPCPDDKFMDKPDKEMQFHSMLDGSRWGRFKPDELFVLYEDKDIEILIHMLKGEL